MLRSNVDKFFCTVSRFLYCIVSMYDFLMFSRINFLFIYL